MIDFLSRMRPRVDRTSGCQSNVSSRHRALAESLDLSGRRLLCFPVGLSSAVQALPCALILSVNASTKDDSPAHTSLSSLALTQGLPRKMSAIRHHPHSGHFSGLFSDLIRFVKKAASAFNVWSASGESTTHFSEFSYVCSITSYE